MTMYELHGVRYTVQENGRAKSILRVDELRLGAGGVTGVIGPNGAGKTTLMRILAGLARPSQGQVLYQGRPLARLSDRERARHIAFMSQNPHVGFGFTVRDVVAMGRYPYRGRLQEWRPDDWAAVEGAMAATGVAHLRDRLITELSGGERQRVFLARALAQAPRVLFLDEPIANLDVRYQLEILSLVGRLRDRYGWTIVMAIHDLNWAMRWCDRLLVLYRGRVAACGPAGTVLDEALIQDVFGVHSRIERDGHRAVRVEFLSA